MTVRTLGIEEELLLLDPATRQVSSRSHEVIKRFREHGAGRDDVARATVATDELDQELFLHQIETRTDPSDDRQDALAQVVAARRTAGEAARDAGLAVVACGVVPMDGFEPVVTRSDRYQDMVERFGQVGPDRRHLRDARARRHRLRRGGRAGHRPAGAVAAGDPRDQRELAVLRGPRQRLRLVALAGLGPLAERRADPAVRVGRGLPRGLRAARRARRRPRPGDALLRRPAGGRSTRPSRSGCPDVCTDPATSLLVAALVRGLVETAATTGDAQDFWRVEMVRAAQWRASRYGVSERLVHPLERTLGPAREVVESLVEAVRPALEEAGDLDFVTEQVESVLRAGGAVRQRAAYERTGDVEGVVDDLVARTEQTWQS